MSEIAILASFKDKRRGAYCLKVTEGIRKLPPFYNKVRGNLVLKGKQRQSKMDPLKTKPVVEYTFIREKV